MTFFSTLLSSAAVATVLTASSALAQTVLTMNNWLPPSHPYFAEILAPLAADIETATEGRVKVNILPAPLGPPPATFDLVKNGVVDIGFSVQGYNTGRFKTARVAEMPLMGNDAAVTSVAFWRVHEAMLAAAGEYDGVKVLTVHTHGPGQIFSTTPIKSVDAIAGQKIRVGSVMAHDLAELLGAVPVEGPSSKSYELLSQGVADGIFFPWESVNFFRLNDIVTNAFITDGGLYNAGFMIIMNDAKWQALPEEDRAAIEPLIGEALARKTGEMWNRSDAAGHAVLSKTLDVYEASPEEVAAIKERVAPVVAENIALVSEAGVDGAAAYEMMLAEIEKLSAE